MMSSDCPSPLSLEELVDYAAGELAAAAEERVEAHYFSCSRCARLLALVEALGAGVTALVRQGAARASVTPEILARITAEGLALRRYVLAPGEIVPCTVAPGDDFVLVELAGLVGAGPGGASIDVETRTLASGATTHHVLLTSLAPESRSILMLFPAQSVRSFPRSRWTLRVSIAGAPQPAAGAYTLDHTPWSELAGDPS